MPAPSLVTQTTYAELLQRCAAAAFSEDFPQDGTFTSKTIKGRRYWYFQLSSLEGRKQKYVGLETPELLDRISRHKEVRDDERERRALVATLIRSFWLPRPTPEIGNITAALARAGVFRLRGVLVGTAAYQTYSAMLGVKLSLSNIQTGDVDIAQFKNVSVAIEDQTPPLLNILKQVDPTFRAVPQLHGAEYVTSYRAKGGFRVDFLTPNEGPETDVPQSLPAFQTDAQPLRFLDYLIHEPEPAVVLHGAGIHVLVPAPERYAIHKLIVSRRRSQGSAKRDKDLQQAEVLLDVLTQKRPYELKSAWNEAYNRGKTWRQLLLEGLGQLTPRARDSVLKVLDQPPEFVPGVDLTFNNPPARYDFSRDVVAFAGDSLGGLIQCAISRETLDDHFGADGLTKEGRLEKFLENRSTIERLARTKYLSRPVEVPGEVLIKTADVSELLSTKRTR
jgi:hypothetical protein